MRARLKSIEVPRVSQFNWHTGASNTWCGRASGAMLYNYYVLVHGGSEADFIVNNRDDDSCPFDLVYPGGRVAAMADSGGFSPSRPLVDDHPGGLGSRFAVDATVLYPKAGRPRGTPSLAEIERILAPLLDYVDRNNPALFASGLSRGRTSHASHFILVTGYEYDDGGALWLEITDPSMNYLIIEEVFKGENLVKRMYDGVYVAAPQSTKPDKAPEACRYKVRADVFFRANPLLVGKGNWDIKKYGNPPDPILFCDNDQNFSKEDGFAVLLAQPVPDTPDNQWVTTVLGLRMPVSVDVSTDWTQVADPNAPYPIGGNRTWHSGVRMLGPAAAGASGAAASSVPDAKVWSIADGTIVAARFPKEPLEPGSPSNGMVLIRHEIDPVTLTVLQPLGQDGQERDAIDECRKAALPFYSLYLHLAPLSEHLDGEGKPSLARSPRWLRAIGPQPPPALVHFVPDTAALRLSSWSDAAFGQAVTIPMTHLVHPPRLEWDPGASKLGGVETTETSLGGVPALIVPVLQGAAQYQAFSKLIGPSLAAPQNRHFYNALTGQVIESTWAPVRLAAGTPLATRIAPRTVVQQLGDAIGTSKQDALPVYELDVLAEIDGFCYVRVLDDCAPGFDVTKLPSSRTWSVHQSALSFDDGEQVRLRAEVGESLRVAKMLAGPGHVMRFSGSGITSGTALPDEVQPDLLPCITLSKRELAGNPTATPEARRLFYYNVLTEQLIETELDVDAGTSLVLDGSRPAVVAQVGDVRYARVQGFRPVLDTARSSGVMGHILRFDSSVTSVRLYAQTTSTGTSRRFPDESVIELAGSRFALAFEVQEEGRTNGRDRIWPKLPSVAKLAKSDVKAMDERLKEKSPAMPILERLRKSHSALYAVELGEEHGWQLGDDGRIAPTGATDVERHLRAVVVQNGSLVPVRVEGESAENPLEVSVAAGLAIQPVHTDSRDGVARVAYFEVIESVPPSARTTNQAEIDRVNQDNAPRQALLDRLADGKLEKLEDVRTGPEWIGWMGATGAGVGVQVEVFSGKNLIDEGVQGSDDTLVPVPGTTWAVLRDDDAQGQFTRGFVKTMYDQVVLSPDFAFDRSALPADAVEYELDGDPKEDEWVPSPTEWLRFCNHGSHPRQLARLIACHALHWREGTADLLDHPDARAAHLDQSTREKIRKDIEAIAFADDVTLDETQQSSIQTTSPVFHYHPLRLVEWLRTGVDVDASYYSQLVTSSGQLQVTLDFGGATGITVDPVPGHPLLFRFRTTIGDATGAVDAVIHLHGFGTATDTIYTQIERGKVRPFQLTPPRVTAGMRLAPRAPALAVPVRVRAQSDLTLLADSGALPESGLAYVEVEGTVHYNVHPPERIEATLSDPSGFEFADPGGPRPEGYDVSFTSNEVVFTRRSDAAAADASPSPRMVRLSVFVAAGASVGAATHVVFKASGGDMVGTVEGSSASVTTRELRRGKQRLGGHDVVKLQLLLSQIPARDRSPCYRFCEKNDYPVGPSVNCDGDYGRGLARAIWRFVDAYVGDTRETWTATVRFLRDGTLEEASVTKDTFATDADTRARLDGTRADYPIVDGPLIAEIVRRFDARYVTPRASFSIDAVSKSVIPTTPLAFAVRASTDKLGSILARTAILPLDDEQVHGTLALEGLLDDTYDVELALPPDSHYRIQAGGAATLEATVTVRRTSPRCDFVLVFGGGEPQQAESPLEALVARSTGGIEMASVGLAGVRDLRQAQSVPGRDIFLLELYLSQILDHSSTTPEPCFRHRSNGKGSVIVDGIHTNELAQAMQRFEAGLSACPPTYSALLEAIRDAYLEAIYAGPGVTPAFAP